MAEQTPPQVIDVREPYEREAGHIAGTRHIELAELTAAGGQRRARAAVVFYCRVGARSEMAAQAFRDVRLRGLLDDGGLLRWAQGRALAPEGGHVAEH